MSKINSIYFSSACFLFGLMFILNMSAQTQFTNTVVALTGNVHNEVTKEPIKIKIEVYDTEGKKVYSTKSNPAENGHYFITGLKPGERYVLRFSSDLSDSVKFLKEKFAKEISGKKLI